MPETRYLIARLLLSLLSCLDFPVRPAGPTPKIRQRLQVSAKSSPRDDLWGFSSSLKVIMVTTCAGLILLIALANGTTCIHDLCPARTREHGRLGENVMTKARVIRLVSNKTILAEQYRSIFALKRQRDRRHCSTDRSHNQTRSLFLSSPSSLAITRQLESINLQQYISIDWVHSKPLLRYTASSAGDKGISLLQILGDGGLGWAISCREILARPVGQPGDPSEVGFLCCTPHCGLCNRSLAPEKQVLQILDVD